MEGAEEWMSVARAAEILGVSEWVLYHEHKAGRLRFLVRRGCSKGYRVSRREIERWMAEEWEEA